MRMSHVLLASAAVAAAGVATSAFTAANTVAPSVAGFGQGAVTGATITDIHYVENTGNTQVLDSIELTSTTNLTGKTVTVTLKTTGGTVVVGTSYACTVKDAWDSTDIVMECDTTGSTRLFSEFDSVGVTVVD
jgi:hypothetical protein